jgi:hypothetical protein
MSQVQEKEAFEEDARQYLERHGIHALYETLTKAAIHAEPDDVRAFLEGCLRSLVDADERAGAPTDPRVTLADRLPGPYAPFIAGAQIRTPRQVYDDEHFPDADL